MVGCGALGGTPRSARDGRGVMPVCHALHKAYHPAERALGVGKTIRLQVPRLRGVPVFLALF